MTTRNNSRRQAYELGHLQVPKFLYQVHKVQKFESWTLEVQQFEVMFKVCKLNSCSLKDCEMLDINIVLSLAIYMHGMRAQWLLSFGYFLTLMFSLQLETKYI